MTAICGGGTSSQRSGFGATVALTVPAIAALLNNIPTVWAVPFAAYLGLVNYELNDFCSTDPPAVPTITAADVAALLTFLDPIGHTQAVAKFEQLVGAYAWYSLCKCDSVATPAPPAPPAAPVGLPSINPPAVGPSYPTGQACQRYSFNVDQGTNIFPPAVKFPLADATFFDLHFSASIAHTTANQWGFNVFFYNSAGTQLGGSLNVGIATTGDFTHTSGAPPAGAVSYAFNAGPTSVPTPNFTGRVDVDVYCNGAQPGGGGGAILQPCPPDPIVTGLLSQILELVALIQRQKVPFAYVPGARHNGLTGNGQFAVQGIIGASVIITTLPPYLGNLAGDPPELFDVGFVTLGTVDGWHRSVRIDHSPTLVLPVEGSETLLGYSLAPGVVVDVLELRREP